VAHEVIMPALGMAQDTGLLVSWLKAPGDAVAKGEALFEVETDKATMEVEAGVAGFLSSVTAAAGTDVPVGEVIARIVATKAEVDASPPEGQVVPAAATVAEKVAALPLAPRAKSPAPEPEPARPASRPALQPVAVPTAGDRILASPKARRLAAEAGLDLNRLAEAGHLQPYHVADLVRLTAMAPAGRSVLTASADATALDALLTKTAPGTDTARIHAAFSAGAWRQAIGPEVPAIAIQRPDGSREGTSVGIVLNDLTGTRLTGYVPATGLALSIARTGATFALTLSFDESQLPYSAAAAWLNELAARIEDPVRQLV
jgi:pyruvate/2-oxoglutarate dehydrogenase complex dihydrolipoamide acyltransferase (E2) component